MVFRVYKTEKIRKLYEDLNTREQEWIDKIILQLKENPWHGKPLRFNWFREKKFEDKRLYYLIYKNLQKVILVSFGNKKDQQRIIEETLKHQTEFEKLAKEL